MNYEIKYQYARRPFLIDLSKENFLYVYRNMQLVEKIDIGEDLTEEQFMETAKIYINQLIDVC